MDEIIQPTDYALQRRERAKALKESRLAESDLTGVALLNTLTPAEAEVLDVMIYLTIFSFIFRVKLILFLLI